MLQGPSPSRNSFTPFAVGALIGAGIALLYAPQSGKETRKLLAQKANLLRDKVQVTGAKTQPSIQKEKAGYATAFDIGTEFSGTEQS